MSLENISKKLLDEFKAKLEEDGGGRKLISLDASNFHDAIEKIQSEFGGRARLLFATAAYIDSSLFWMAEINCPDQQALSVRARVEPGMALPSLRDIWPYADWQEREAQELFGIQFIGATEFEAFLVRNARVEFPHRRQ